MLLPPSPNRKVQRAEGALFFDADTSKVIEMCNSGTYHLMTEGA